MNKKIITKFCWIVFGLLSIGLKLFFDQHPNLAETYYSRYFFLGVRWFFDFFITWIPVAFIYLFFLILGWRLVVSGRRFYQWPFGRWKKLGYAVLSIISFVLGGIGVFFWLWGYNYSRISIEDHLGISPEPLNLEQLKTALDAQTKIMIESRQAIPGLSDTLVFNEELLPRGYEKAIRASVIRWLAQNNYPTVGRVRGRELYPKGIFLRFSSSGLYFPFTAEGHVDAGVHALQKPYIIAHEMSHGYGFGDEGTCNFVGFLAASSADHPVLAYSGHLSYWRTLATNYLRYRPKEYRAYRARLPLGIQKDLDAINQVLRDYPDIMPRFRYYAYDTYLKAQGIQEGIQNYNRVIMLVKAWEEKGGMSGEQ